MAENETWPSIKDVKIAESVHRWIIRVILNPLFVLGISFNCISIYVFYHLRSRSTVSQLYLICLAVADLMYLLFMLEYTSEYWGLYKIENYSDKACATLFYLRGTFGTWSSFLLVAFSVDRLLYCRGALHLLDHLTCAHADHTQHERGGDGHMRRVSSTLFCSHDEKYLHRVHSNEPPPIKPIIREPSDGRTNVEQLIAIEESHQRTTFIMNSSISSVSHNKLRHIRHAVVLIGQLIRSSQFVIGFCLFLACCVTVPRLLSFNLSSDHAHITCRSNRKSGVPLVLHMVSHIVFQRLGSTMMVLVVNVMLYRFLQQIQTHIIHIGSKSPQFQCDNCCPQQSTVITVRSHEDKLMHEVALVRVSIILATLFTLLFLPPGVHWTYIYLYEQRLIHQSQQQQTQTNTTQSDQGTTQRYLSLHSLIGDLEAVAAALNHVVNFLVYYFTLPQFRVHVQQLRQHLGICTTRFLVNKLLGMNESAATRPAMLPGRSSLQQWIPLSPNSLVETTETEVFNVSE